MFAIAVGVGLGVSGKIEEDAGEGHGGDAGGMGMGMGGRRRAGEKKKEILGVVIEAGIGCVELSPMPHCKMFAVIEIDDDSLYALYSVWFIISWTSPSPPYTLLLPSITSPALPRTPAAVSDAHTTPIAPPIAPWHSTPS